MTPEQRSEAAISWASTPMSRRAMLTGLGVGSLVALAACTADAKKDSAKGSGGSTSSSSAAPAPDATISVSIPDATADVAPATPLTVTAAGGTLDAVSVATKNGGVVNGAVDAATATWTPTDQLEFGASYSVIATATNPDGKSTQIETSFATASAKTLVFPSIGPLDGTVVGVAMPVRVYFDAPMPERAAVQQALSVVSEPAQNGQWNWISDTEVHWRPQVYWQAGTKVTVNVNLYGVHGGNGAYGKVSRTIAFDVGANKVATCNTQEHQMHCYEDGALVRSIPIAAGKEEQGRYTHSGIHVVTEKRPEMTMDSTTYGLALDAGGYQTKVYWATRISNNGEFVHAAPWSLADQGVRNVSHGCLNASPENAQWYQQWCQIGDPVEITGTPVPLTVADGDIFDWTIPWETWVTGSAL